MPSWHTLHCFITACQYLSSNRIRLPPGGRHPKTPTPNERPNPVGLEPERETPRYFTCGNGSMVRQSMIHGRPIITFSCILNNYQRRPPFSRPVRFSLAPHTNYFSTASCQTISTDDFFLFSSSTTPMSLSLIGLSTFEKLNRSLLICGFI